MTSGIGGAGGIGGPRGPSGPTGPRSGDAVEGPGEALSAEATRAAEAARGPGAAQMSSIDRLAADLDAGRISADDALAQLMADAVPDGMPAADRADLREALLDLLATDPYLAGLAARLGATPAVRDEG